MEPENTEPVDLFGNPWRPLRDQRGRKSHRWAREVSENVAVLRATGLSHDDVANRVGLDPKTLRKYYSRELDNGAMLAKARLDEVMWTKAMAGNVGAARYVRESFDVGRAKRAAAPATRTREPILGKKEIRQAAARNVAGLYSTPRPPRATN